MSSEFFDFTQLPEGVRKYFSQQNTQWLPQFGTTFLEEAIRYEIPFKIPYKKPPTVLLTPIARKIDKTQISDPYNPFNVSIKIDTPKITEITLPKLSLPPLSIDPITINKIEVGDIPQVFIDEIQAEVNQLTFSLERIVTQTLEKIQKLPIQFPSPPQITAWQVEWRAIQSKMGDFGIQFTTQISNYTAIQIPGFEVVANVEESEPSVTQPPIYQAGTNPYISIPDINEVVLEPISEPIATDPQPTTTTTQTTVKDTSFDDGSTRSSPTLYTRKGLFSRIRNKRNRNALGSVSDNTIDLDEQSIVRNLSQFFGMFNFDFGSGGIIGTQKDGIGFVAHATLKVEDNLKILITMGGTGGFRLFVGPNILIDSYAHSPYPKVEVIQFDLKPGETDITIHWYNWDAPLPSVFFSTFPPVLPEIARLEFDLENAMELAYLGAWNFIRDSINDVYQFVLPTWNIRIPALWFPGVLIWEGKTWKIDTKLKEFTIEIPRLEVPRTRITRKIGFEMDLATPFVAANTAFFNLLSIFPRWFGRYTGRTTGRHISSAINMVVEITKGIYESLKGTGENIVNYFNSSIDELENKVDQTIEKYTQELQSKLDNIGNEFQTKTLEALTLLDQTLVSKVNWISTQFSISTSNAINGTVTTLKDKFQQALQQAIDENSIRTNAQLDQMTEYISHTIQDKIANHMLALGQQFNEKISELNSKTTEQTNKALAIITKEVNTRVNNVLGTIVKDVLEAAGLNYEKYGTTLTQPNLIEVTKSRFIVEGLKGGVTLNWIAIGDPDIKGPENIPVFM